MSVSAFPYGGLNATFPLSASADKSSVSGGGSGFSACGDPGGTDTVTVTATGGREPYSYSWARVGSAATHGPYQATSPSNRITNFSDVDSNVCDPAAQSNETWRCTVTDDVGATATVDVDVDLTWSDIS